MKREILSLVNISVWRVDSGLEMRHFVILKTVGPLIRWVMLCKHGSPKHLEKEEK